MSDFYCYVYRDPRPHKKNEPIYVGKGKGSRFLKHLDHCTNVRFRNKLKAIKNEGLTPRIEIWSTEDEETAISLEIWFIFKYGRLDLKTGSLCNNTEGGEGTSKRIASAKTKQKISDSLKGNNPSLITRQKISKANSGRKQSIAERESHRIAQQKFLKENPNHNFIQRGRENVIAYRAKRSAAIELLWPSAKIIIDNEPKINGWIGAAAIKLGVTRAVFNKYVVRYRSEIDASLPISPRSRSK